MSELSDKSSKSWITDAISKQHIHLYAYSEFKNLTEFGENQITSADWPCSERKVILKKSKIYNVRKFVQEVN